MTPTITRKRPGLLWVVSLLAALWAAAPAGAQAPTPIPASGGAPKVGEKAPDFTLPDSQGKPVTLSEALKPRQPGEKPWGLLIFYRGYW